MDSYLLDTSLEVQYRSLDVLCFSNQFYYIISLLAWGMVLVVLALQVVTINKYNTFNDPFSVIFLLLIFILYEFLAY